MLYFLQFHKRLVSLPMLILYHASQIPDLHVQNVLCLEKNINELIYCHSSIIVFIHFFIELGTNITIELPIGLIFIYLFYLFLKENIKKTTFLSRESKSSSLERKSSWFRSSSRNSLRKMFTFSNLLMVDIRFFRIIFKISIVIF